MEEEKDIIAEKLEQRRQVLEAKRELEEERARRQMLFVRNVLNTVFILLALAAMTGVLMAKTEGMQTVFYYVAIVAIVVKMVEVMLRTLKKPLQRK